MNVPVFRQVSQYRNFNSGAKVLIAFNALLAIPNALYFIDLTIYLNRVGYSSLTIGYFLSIELLLGSIISIFLGVLADRVGRKKILLLGLLFLAFSTVVLSLSDIYLEVLLGVAFFGLYESAINAGFYPFLAEKTTLEERNVVFATSAFLSRIASVAGMLIGSLPPLIAGIFNLSTFDSFRFIFLLSFVFALATILLILRLNEDYAGTPRSHVLPRGSLRLLFKLSVLSLLGLGSGVLVMLFPLWFRLKFGISLDSIGPIFAISSLVIAFASFTTPEIAKKIGEVRTIVYTQIPSIGILVVLPFSPFYLLAGILFIVRSVLMNMSGPILYSFAMSMVNPDERARGSSIINAFDSVPRSAGPSLGGYFFNQGDLQAPFYITAVLYSICTILFFTLFKRAGPSENAITRT
ncbi:MAG: MFS transporter [Thermoplasmataceae archaeon]